MPQRKEPKFTPEQQYERFKEVAKEAGLTDNEREFEKAFDAVAPQKPKDAEPANGPEN